MAEIDVDAAMLAYLGGDPTSAGVRPAGMEKRLRKFYGDAAPEMKRVLDKYLERLLRFPVKKGFYTLATVANAVAEWVGIEMPELSPVTRSKLGCYYTYVMSR